MFGSIFLAKLILKRLRKQNDLRARAIQNSTLRRERAMLRRVFAVDFLPDAEFKMTYRLTKCTFKKLLEIVSPHLTTSRWNNRLFPETKLLIALRFFASGSYQLCIGKNRETSSAQSTVSKVLTEVINVFEHVVCPQFITFPTLQEREEIKEWFVTKHKIPNVIGCIDGTQIGIYPPSEHENVYMNRKGFHSINVQIICDHTYRIRNVVAKYPGSAHDSYVYKYSTIRDQLQDEFLHGNDSQWLLADSGYPLEPWMLTPFAANSEDPHEILYNRHFCGARCLVERVIGLLKGHWRCLCKQRQLHYHPRKAGRIINCCVALHNFCILEKDGLLDEFEQDELEVYAPVHPPNNLFELGEQNRNYVIGHLLVHH